MMMMMMMTTCCSCFFSGIAIAGCVQVAYRYIFTWSLTTCPGTVVDETSVTSTSMVPGNSAPKDNPPKLSAHSENTVDGRNAAPPGMYKTR